MNVTTAGFLYHPGVPPRMEPIPICTHEKLRFTWRIFNGANQPKRYGYQCVRCGAGGHKSRSGDMYSQWVADRNAFEYFGCYPEEAVSYHDALTADLARARNEFFAARHEQRAGMRESWWDWYKSYLESPAWKDKREATFRRDNFKCQACGSRSEQVHHIRYTSVGYEPLEDLVSVCAACHQEIHG